MMNEILNFIKRRFPEDCNWKNGNCYFFAVILKARFPEGEIFYETVLGHFLFKLNGVYYDHDGVFPEADIRLAVPWDSFEEYDSLRRGRIIRDCIA